MTKSALCKESVQDRTRLQPGVAFLGQLFPPTPANKCQCMQSADTVRCPAFVHQVSMKTISFGPPTSHHTHIPEVVVGTSPGFRRRSLHNLSRPSLSLLSGGFWLQCPFFVSWGILAIVKSDFRTFLLGVSFAILSAASVCFSTTNGRAVPGRRTPGCIRHARAVDQTCSGSVRGHSLEK